MKLETAQGLPQRMGSVDVYRGLVMFLMMAEVLALGRVAEGFPGSEWWALLAWHQSHVPWVGCTLHDLIQPSFSFLVGVALPFSIANRLARGQSLGRMVWHASWRALVLVLLGIFLRSMGKPQTNFTFEDTLTQIGLGYPFLFALGLMSARWQWGALGVILLGYWAVFAFYPLPGSGFDWTAAGVASDWPHHLQGFAAHWNKNTNAAWAFDVWFLNLLPRAQAFLHNGGGYSTLSFIPTLGTMILGLVAGRWLREGVPAKVMLQRMVLAGVLGLVVGWTLGALGLCPVVKRIWTPSWVLFSGGWCFLILALMYFLVDVCRLQFWFFPLVVIGMNSIAAYCMDWMCAGFIRSSLRTHLSPGAFAVLGQGLAPLLEGAAVLGVMWGILFWMYRRKVFLKI